MVPGEGGGEVKKKTWGRGGRWRHARGGLSRP